MEVSLSARAYLLSSGVQQCVKSIAEIADGDRKLYDQILQKCRSREPITHWLSHMHAENVEVTWTEDKISIVFRSPAFSKVFDEIVRCLHENAYHTYLEDEPVVYKSRKFKYELVFDELSLRFRVDNYWLSNKHVGC